MGTILVVNILLLGIVSKSPPKQIDLIIFAISGFGFTVTVIEFTQPVLFLNSISVVPAFSPVISIKFLIELIEFDTILLVTMLHWLVFVGTSDAFNVIVSPIHISKSVGVVVKLFTIVGCAQLEQIFVSGKGHKIPMGVNVKYTLFPALNPLIVVDVIRGEIPADIDCGGELKVPVAPTL